jgi:hypothetical protein
MEIIKIERTSTTPSVLFDFDNNRYEIKGCSRPEDVVAFYGQLIDWLTDIKRNINDELKAKTAQNPMVFKLCYDYFNSSSAKYILDIVLLINKLFESGLQVAIEWQYKKEDEDMLETGKEFTDLIKCPINFVAF